MKAIKIHKEIYFTDYIYKNNISKRVWRNGQIFWFTEKYSILNKKDGAALQNCCWCNINICYRLNPNNKYKRHFYLDNKNIGKNIKEIPISIIEFAEKTEHKICLICNDFCNQECFV